MKLKTKITNVYVVEVYADDIAGALNTGYSLGTKKDAEKYGQYLIEETRKGLESGDIIIDTLATKREDIGG